MTRRSCSPISSISPRWPPGLRRSGQSSCWAGCLPNSMPSPPGSAWKRSRRRATAAAGFGERLQLRIGVHSGALIAGVIGTHKFVYDVWGDTVNTAKRMESYGAPGRIHVSAIIRQVLGDGFRFEPRGAVEVKGKGRMETY